MTSHSAVPCPDCGHALAQDALGVICAGCGARLYLVDRDGPLPPERLREAVTGHLWGAAVRSARAQRGDFNDANHHSHPRR